MIFRNGGYHCCFYRNNTFHHLRNLSVIVYELWLFIISGCLLSVIVYELWLFIIDNTGAAGRNITDVKSGIDTTLIPSPNRHETMT